MTKAMYDAGTEIGVDTLAERVAGEAIANGSVLVCRSEIGAWSRVAAPA